MLPHFSLYLTPKYKCRKKFIKIIVNIYPIAEGPGAAHKFIIPGRETDSKAGRQYKKYKQTNPEEMDVFTLLTLSHTKK